MALVNADARLNKILLKVCDESLNARKKNNGALRVTVENTIAPLLPHGQANAHVVATKLGMSERTLSRRLAEEGVTFIEDTAAAQGELSQPLFRGRGHPNFEDRLASRF